MKREAPEKLPPNTKKAKLELLKAISEDDVEALEKYLQENPDSVNYLDQNEGTLLHCAVKVGSSKIVSYISARKIIDINAEDKQGNTALHLAVDKGYGKIVDIFLQDKGCDLSKRNEARETPLQIVAAYGDTEIVKKLLGLGQVDDIDREKDEHYGTTALHLAALEGRVETADILIHHEGNNIYAFTEEHWNALHLAIVAGQTQVVELFLKSGKFDINEKGEGGRTPLYLAAQFGRIEIAKMLLENKGCDVNHYSDYGTALDAVAEKENTEMCKLLVLGTPSFEDVIESSEEVRTAVNDVVIIFIKEWFGEASKFPIGKALTEALGNNIKLLQLYQYFIAGRQEEFCQSLRREIEDPEKTIEIEEEEIEEDQSVNPKEQGEEKEENNAEKLASDALKRVDNFIRLNYFDLMKWCKDISIPDSPNADNPLLRLPPEIAGNIVSYVSPLSLLPNLLGEEEGGILPSSLSIVE